MRIAILTQYFPPEIGAPQRRLSELAAFLVERGHRVTVLTAMPSYPTGNIFAPYRGRIHMHELSAGVDVFRAPVFPSQSAAFAPRLASYFSFVASSAVAGSFDLPRCDYLMVESPPLFLGMSAVVLSRLKRAKLIFNVSDLWPESAARLGVVSRESTAYRAAERLEKFLYRRAWIVSGQSRAILADIERRFPGTATFHFSNGCETAKFGGALRDEDVRRRLIEDATPRSGAALSRDISGVAPRGGGASSSENGDGRFLSLYAGLHGLAQGLDQILDAADRLRADPRFTFALVGDGPEKKALASAARSRGLDSVRFHDAVAADAVPRLLASSDAIMVTLKTDIPGAVPSKIYEAMASERPVILAASGEAADIVRAAGNFVVAPGDGPALAEVLRMLRDDPAAARRASSEGRAAAVGKFDRRAIASRFIARLEASA